MEILFVVLLLLLIFAVLLIITCIVNFLVHSWTVYHDIADMIKARKGVSCCIDHSSRYGDLLCCGNCKSLIESDYEACLSCHYRIIMPKALRRNHDLSHHDDICMDGVAADRYADHHRLCRRRISGGVAD